MTLGAISHILWPEGRDVILIDRPPLPTGVAMVYGDLVATTNYVVSVFDLDSTTPTVNLFAGTPQTGDANASDSSNLTGAPVMAAAVVASTGTFGLIWTQDATGYVFLFSVLQSELDTAMEGGHTYRIEVKLITTLYGDLYSEWIVTCLPLAVV